MYLVLRVPDQPYLCYVKDGKIHVHEVSGSVSVMMESPPPSELARLLAERFQNSTVVEALRGPGVFHRNVWRGAGTPSPILWFTGNASTHLEPVFASLRAVELLCERLLEICHTIEPTPANNAAFGPRLRELLILAATECEACFTQVLQANAYPPGRWSTNDYAKLVAPMRLCEWEVDFTYKPSYPRIVPFKNWDAAHPTKTLWWYDAYNAAKHDRNANIRRATFEAVLNAVAAAFVLINAQYGPDYVRSQAPSLHASFFISRTPSWAPVERYFAWRGS